MTRRFPLFAAALSFLLTSVTAGTAQTGTGSSSARLQASREELQALLKGYEESAKSGAYSPKLRERAQYEASLIRQRLEEGDFQVGDRIALVVEGEPTLSDTLVVTSDIAVVLTTGEKVPLKNVLRSEVGDKLHTAIARVVKEPTVRSETYMRIAILGAVGKQGFYELRSDQLLTDVLNQVGIPTGALLDKMSVERDKKKIWEGEALQTALSEGRTLDQLSLRAGDVITIPGQTVKNTNFFANARSLLMIIPAFFAIRRVLRN